jgi:hypothetical protein
VTAGPAFDEGSGRTPDDADLQRKVAAQFVALAERLSTVSEAAWDTRRCVRVGAFAKWSPT